MNLERAILWSKYAGVACGILFVVLWVVAESGRYAIEERAVGYVLLGVLLVIAPFLPLTSLVGLAIIPIAQTIGLLARPESTDWPMYLAMPIVLAIVALRDERRYRVPAVAATLLASVAIGAALAFPRGRSVFVWMARQFDDSGWGAWTASSWSPAALFATITLIALTVLLGGWAVGAAVRYAIGEKQARAVLADAELDLASSETERQLAAQREDIARDVHDVLAHSLTVIIAQADGEMASGSEDPVLERLSRIARESLVDVRALIERLDGDEPSETAPGLNDLASLVTRFTSAGMEIDLHEEGNRPLLADGLQLTVYRLVQECLTNALKHGGRGVSTIVRLDWRGDELAMHVSSRGSSLPAPSTTGRSIGLSSMRERARMAGGWLTAGPDGEDFIVTAILPLRVVDEAALR